MPDIQSPCVAICFLNESDICEGCFRSSAEITDWTVMTEQEQKQVLENCQQRRKDSGLVL